MIAIQDAALPLLWCTPEAIIISCYLDNESGTKYNCKLQVADVIMLQESHYTNYFYSDEHLLCYSCSGLN